MWFKRDITPKITATVKHGKSILLFGPRQTGKTSLVKKLPSDLYINLMRDTNVTKYESNPNILREEIEALNLSLGKKPLVIIDEIQRIPNITDSIQVLIDDEIAQFILTGSSARKIKNLLPGRVIKYTLSPLMLSEVATETLDINKIITNGTLPEIFKLDNQIQIDELLNSYVSLYIEEEIRKEALVRNVGAFTNFLRLACIESGNLVNLRSIASEIGISHNTIAEYYRILHDCMLVETIYPLTKQVNRKRLSKSPKHIIFDLGVRRLGAHEGYGTNERIQARNFEQYIGLELCRLSRTDINRFDVLYWRSHDGPEVDYVLDHGNYYTPIEVKWTTNPTSKDIKHLLRFSEEYNVSNTCYLICRIDKPRKLDKNVIALPWQLLATVLNIVNNN